MTTATAPYSAAPQVKVRPLGVTIIAVLEFLEGLVYLLAALGMFAVGAMAGSAGIIGGMFAGLAVIFGAIFLILALVFLLLGWGLWTGKGWAWTIAFVLGIIAILLGLVSIVSGNLTQILGIVIQFIILYYLYQPRVKVYFGKA